LLCTVSMLLHQLFQGQISLETLGFELMVRKWGKLILEGLGSPVRGIASDTWIQSRLAVGITKCWELNVQDILIRKRKIVYTRQWMKYVKKIYNHDYFKRKICSINKRSSKMLCLFIKWAKYVCLYASWNHV
jgi:hypothetical protein